MSLVYMVCLRYVCSPTEKGMAPVQTAVAVWLHGQQHPVVCKALLCSADVDDTFFLCAGRAGDQATEGHRGSWREQSQGVGAAGAALLLKCIELWLIWLPALQTYVPHALLSETVCLCAGQQAVGSTRGPVRRGCAAQAQGRSASR